MMDEVEEALSRLRSVETELGGNPAMQSYIAKGEDLMKLLLSESSCQSGSCGQNMEAKLLNGCVLYLAKIPLCVASSFAKTPKSKLSNLSQAKAE